MSKQHYCASVWFQNDAMRWCIDINLEFRKSCSHIFLEELKKKNPLFKIIFQMKIPLFENTTNFTYYLNENRVNLMNSNSMKNHTQPIIIQKITSINIQLIHIPIIGMWIIFLTLIIFVLYTNSFYEICHLEKYIFSYISNYYKLALNYLFLSLNIKANDWKRRNNYHN